MKHQEKLRQCASKPLTFPRADPDALKAFDPSTKICVMNCGPYNLDPRDSKERKFLCDDCYPATPRLTHNR